MASDRGKGSKVKTVKREENVFWGEYEAHDIEIFRERLDEDWYIIVQGDGGYLYDGYFNDSADATIDEAIEEALEGSGL